MRDRHDVVHRVAYRYDWQTAVVLCEDEQAYAMIDYGWRWAKDASITCMRCLAL